MCGVPCETFFDERVDIDAKVNPFVFDYLTSRDFCMHLVGHDSLGTVCKSEFFPTVVFVSHIYL